jgi:poly(3-hydroxybutyrate) depolymerase
MIYTAYELMAQSLRPWQDAAQWGAGLALRAHERLGWPAWRGLSADLEVLRVATITHDRPDFGIASVADASGQQQPVTQDVVQRTPFAQLLRFRRAGGGELPRILLVAPMSGHFATLLAGTVRTLLQDHEVYLTDWLNPRDIPPSQGRFGFSEYVQHLLDFLHLLGPGVHLMGVCQPAVTCLAAAALLAEDGDPCQPASIILMAGPIDTRHSPTRVNQLAAERPIDWFERNLVSTVPLPHAGAGRRVYPGFLQLTAFMSMNRDRHLQAFRKLRELRAAGEDAQADAIADFYREYLAVMDLPAEFYLETVQWIFQEHRLATGRLHVHGHRIDCSAIRRPFLLTIEGERDDICGMGQTLAAQDLCSRMAPYRKSHHLQAGVGHYGVFNGKRWERRIYPVVRAFIQATI